MATPDRFEGFPDSEARFFKQLAKNNRRDWFVAHRKDFDEGWAAPMNALLSELREKIDRHYPHCDLGEPKQFRIFRDVRFSKDKSPYKTHIGGVLPLASSKRMVEAPAALYVHIGADELMAGAGQYMMDPQQLARYRAAVLDDKRGRELAKMVASLEKRGYGFESYQVMKRAPKGIDPAHPRASLLARKGLVVMYPELPKKLLVSRKLIDWLATHVKASAPVVEWLAFATA